MKKILALLLALCMIFALVACGQPTTEEPKTEEPAAEETGTEEPATEETPAEEPAKEVTNQIIYGSTTELSGDLGNAWWTNNAADKMIRDLIDDYDVVVTDQGGEFVYNETVVKDVSSEENEDGTKTYTVTINEGLVYNNGDPITAADYVAYELVALSPAVKAGGAKTTGEIIVGGT
jgi:peptide/nickel transport system substrate-binding protein